MTQIALFGTSADPPTIGHQSILRWLSDNYDQVAVWAADNPFKEHGASLQQRSEMLKLLIADLNRDNVRVDERLSDRRTLKAVQVAREIWGEAAELHLVIGSDLASQITRWYRAKDLLQEVTLLIFPRKGYPLPPEAIKQLNAFKSNWQEADYKPPSVSSSEYRVQGRSSAVIQAIAEYTQANDLYQK